MKSLLFSIFNYNLHQLKGKKVRIFHLDIIKSNLYYGYQFKKRAGLLMIDTQILHLLTQEYTLVMAMDEKDIALVKEVRQKTLLPVYQHHAEIKDEDRFLYNEDDEQSFIYLLRHNPSGEYVGTIRVFFVNHRTPIRKIPMQMYGHVEGIESLVAQYPVCEISRLALAPNLPSYENISALRLRTYLTVGLMSTIGTNIFLYHSNNIFSIMEPALHRILKRQGINFHPIGPAVEYYGKRIPHMIKREELITESKDILGEITLFYLKELCRSPEKFWQFIDRHPYLERSDIHLDRICELFKLHGDAVDIPFLLQHS
jgi:hypothetical protein